MKLAQPSTCGVVLVGLLSLGAGCADSVKLSEKEATAHAEKLAKLAATDVEEIRRGLPKGGLHLGEGLFTGDAKDNILPTRARAALKKTREAVTDLQLAKSTFFAVTDADGIVLANDQEVDLMVGKNLITTFPGLAKAKSEYVESFGAMEEAKGVKTGADGQWVAAAPVMKAGALQGLYVTGWSWRRFAHHLEEQFKSDMRQEAAKSGNKNKIPLVYVFVVQGDAAYGAPVTPEVNQQAIQALKLATTVTGEAAWTGRTDITNRTFGVGAKRVPALCKECLVAVMRSEI